LETGHRNKCLVILYEFLGTGFLIYSVNTQAGSDFGQMGIPFMLFAWLLIGGGITGGHYNPAVTLGVLIADDHMIYDLIMALLMMTAQFAGAVGGCCMAYFTLVDPNQSGDAGAGIGEEYIHMLRPA